MTRRPQRVPRIGVFTLSLLVLFGLLAIMFTYRALTQSTDSRSRANEFGIVLGRWTFDDGSDGWRDVSGETLQTDNGALHVSVRHDEPPVRIINDAIVVAENAVGRSVTIRASAGNSSVLGTQDSSSTQPFWFQFIPAQLRNFLELLYLWVFVYQRPTDMSYLLEGIFDAEECSQPGPAYALHPGTDVCYELPDPCSVPDDWTPVDTCAPTGTLTPTPTPTISGGCIRTGCSSQICSDHEVASTCEYLSEYSCLASAVCERQSDGECGWTHTEAYDACIAELDVTPTPTPASTRNVSFSVITNLTPQDTAERLHTIPADGQSHEVTIDLPEGAITHLEIAVQDTGNSFTNQGVSAIPVAIEDITLRAMVIGDPAPTDTKTPSPTPPVGCYYQQVQCFQAPCDPILVCPSPSPTCTPRPACLDQNPPCSVAETADMCPPSTPTPTPNVQEGCMRTGCSGQICADEEMMSTCEYLEIYACLTHARCERQSDGECGWTYTDSYNECAADVSSINDVQQ